MLSHPLLPPAVLLSLFLFPPLASSVSPSVDCDSEFQTNICLTRNYSSMEIPLVGEPNRILIGLHINDILKVNDRDFSITFSLYFNVQWREPRIRLNPSFYLNSSQDENQLIPVDLNLINDLWVPNVFIYNLQTFKVMDVLSKLAGLWMNGRKEVMYSQASQVTFICPMIFNYFPLDTQVCKFQVGSYSYNIEKMIFEVTHLGYAHTARAIVLDYDLSIGALPESDKIFDGGPLGNFSLAGFQIRLSRHISHYIITYYLPSGLFVVVSWISFLVPPDVIPGRMALLVTLFLVLVNIFNTVTTNTPKAEGLTAIEAWMLACILFVFGALTEYACLLFGRRGQVDRFVKQRGKEEEDDNNDDEEDDDDDDDDNSCDLGHHTSRPESLNLQELIHHHTCQQQQQQQQQLIAHFHEGQQQQTQQTVQQRRPDQLDLLAEKRQKQKQRRDYRRRMRRRINRSILDRQKTYARIDRFFLVLFPLLFTSFNVAYWYFYLYGQKEEEDFEFTH